MKILLVILFSGILFSQNLAFSYEFPSWIKSTTGFECDGFVTEHTYLHSVQYMIDNGIILESSSGNKKTPAWIQNNFCWWADGLIPDNEFVSGLQYLASKKIISSPEVSKSSSVTKITYGYESLPSSINQQIVFLALENALRNWELANTKLDFELATNKNPDILIKWQMYSNYTHDGFAEIAFINDKRVYDKGTIYASFGTDNCKRQYIQHDTDRMTNILMHEIGHVLGLEHHVDEVHLMFGEDATSRTFDNMGYLIPKRMNDYFVGQGELADKVDFLGMELDSMIISLEQLEQEYKKYEGRQLPSSEYETAQKLYDEIENLVSEINLKVTEHNGLVEELNCFPNVRN